MLAWCSSGPPVGAEFLSSRLTCQCHGSALVQTNPQTLSTPLQNVETYIFKHLFGLYNNWVHKEQPLSPISVSIIFLWIKLHTVAFKIITVCFFRERLKILLVVTRKFIGKCILFPHRGIRNMCQVYYYYAVVLQGALLDLCNTPDFFFFLILLRTCFKLSISYNFLFFSCCFCQVFCDFCQWNMSYKYNFFTFFTRIVTKIL